MCCRPRPTPSATGRHHHRTPGRHPTSSAGGAPPQRTPGQRPRPHHHGTPGLRHTAAATGGVHGTRGAAAVGQTAGASPGSATPKAQASGAVFAQQPRRPVLLPVRWLLGERRRGRAAARLPPDLQRRPPGSAQLLWQVRVPGHQPGAGLHRLRVLLQLRPGGGPGPLSRGTGRRPAAGAAARFPGLSKGDLPHLWLANLGRRNGCLPLPGRLPADGGPVSGPYGQPPWWPGSHVPRRGGGGPRSAVLRPVRSDCPGP